MAFTLDILQPYINQMLDRNNSYHQSEPNLSFAKEYLTGVTVVLPQFVQSSFNSRFSILFPLLKGPNVIDEDKE